MTVPDVTTFDIGSTLTGIATLIAAVGALVVSAINHQRVTEAKTKVDSAAKTADESKVEITKVGDRVYELGKAVDGRLSELLKITEAAARAKGKLEGVAEEHAKVISDGNLH